MVEITEDSTGVTLSIRVQPKASSDRIAGEHAGALKVCVTAAPENGKANAAVIRLLAKRLGVARSRLTITSGQTARCKKVHIDTTSAEQVKAKLNLV